MATVVLSADMVAAATGGRHVAGPGAAAFKGVSIDSRTTPAGALFVALRGAVHDGHAFIQAAIARGAAGVLAESMPADTGSASVILVPDSLGALQRLARTVRRASGTRVIAITGSVGKTTTKEAAATLLQPRYHVFRNKGNLNNHIGLPLSLIELRHSPDIAVVELGMNHAGEIRALVGIAEPDVRVWTNVGDAHIGFFGSRDAVGRAKAEILERASSSTLLIANADDAIVMQHARSFPGRTVGFGESPAATVRASGVTDRGFEGTQADVVTPAGSLRLETSLAGRAQLSNVLAAVAIAVSHDVPLADIERGVRSLRAFDRRGAVTTLADGARIVDDSYNASPVAVQAMLAALAATPTTGRRIAVLGEMLELGDQSYALHADCGLAAARAGVDTLVVVGGEAADGLVEGATRGGLTANRILRFYDSRAAADAASQFARAGDLVLVKGSRGTRTDIVADRLKEVA